MRHLQDEELVGLVFEELAGKDRAACKEHIEVCPKCNAALEGLASAVALLEKEPTEPAPSFAWSRLKARIERSGARRDWADPAWPSLILGHAGGIVLVLTFVFLAGGWLETASVWQSIRTWPLAAQVGPRWLAALVFFGAGALVTLALTPVFWWESRRPENGSSSDCLARQGTSLGENIMSNKRRILWKMTCIGIVVFAAAAIGLSLIEYLRQDSARRHDNEWAEKREELIRKYRSYLQETAKKVVSLPVDPNIVGQAQARYFEEYPNARLYLWAMNTSGRFQFGVPGEAFARLNRAYDTYLKVIEQEGRFTDRQDFLRRLVQDHRNLDFDFYEKKLAGQELPQRGNPWQGSYGNDNEGLVFSTPFQNEQGEMLGNLYLKVAGIDDRRWYGSSGYEGPQIVAGILFGASALFLWFLLPTWVYLDAKGRGMDSPARWSALTLVSLVFGLAVYLIVRPEEGAKGVCQNCGRTASGEKYCPFCGTPVTNEFCTKCGYPARPEWTYCPNCQMAIQKVPEPAPEAQGPIILPEPHA